MEEPLSDSAGVADYSLIGHAYGVLPGISASSVPYLGVPRYSTRTFYGLALGLRLNRRTA